MGLNHFVGSKWPTKAMGKNKWEQLAQRLDTLKLTYSWQQGMNNLYDYMDWIAGCDVLVSNDSLCYLVQQVGKRYISMIEA